ncbi:MAG TPA: iron-sulfur cluster assembly accessory protein [Chitinophagaceae bacterium]|nr:iron-sulfur cluster assembly accessory protein [Chitinophagaceae bacterium]
MTTSPTTQLPVTFTEGAVAELRRLFTTDATKPFLRVGVKGGGCSGMTYVLEYDESTENDLHFDVEGIQVIMDKSHELYLFGVEIAFEGGLSSRGFTFQNPNASSTCGCGTSFAV